MEAVVWTVDCGGTAPPPVCTFHPCSGGGSIEPSGGRASEAADETTRRVKRCGVGAVPEELILRLDVDGQTRRVAISRVVVIAVVILAIPSEHAFRGVSLGAENGGWANAEE